MPPLFGGSLDHVVTKVLVLLSLYSDLVSIVYHHNLNHRSALR